MSVAVTPEYWLVGIGMASSGVTVPAREQVVDAVQREAEQLVTNVVGERGAAAAQVDVRVRVMLGLQPQPWSSRRGEPTCSSSDTAAGRVR